jgi:hypothetical protein
VGVGGGTYFNVYEVASGYHAHAVSILRLDGNWSERCVYALLYPSIDVHIKINCVVKNYLNGSDKIALTKIYYTLHVQFCPMMSIRTVVTKQCEQ